MPGDTTYLDTPVVSIAAFANPPTFPVDCEQADPHADDRVGASRAAAPRRAPIGPFVVAGSSRSDITLHGQNARCPTRTGTAPRYRGRPITRDYRFGGRQGQVWLEDADGDRTIALSSPGNA